MCSSDLAMQGRTPVLGANGLVYVVDDTGTLFVRDANGLTRVWSAALPATGQATQVAEVALDVLRDTSGNPLCSTNRGVLYVLFLANGVATLRAIIVDSPGLANAPWPKFQHDNANTGSADTSLAPWVCP